MPKNKDILRLADDAQSAGFTVEDHWDDPYTIGIKAGDCLWYVSNYSQPAGFFIISPDDRDADQQVVSLDEAITAMQTEA